MTTAQAVARFQKEAERHRAAGHWNVGHEWQRRADEMRHLAGMAERLPTARARRTGVGKDAF